MAPKLTANRRASNTQISKRNTKSRRSSSTIMCDIKSGVSRLFRFAKHPRRGAVKEYPPPAKHEVGSRAVDISWPFHRSRERANQTDTTEAKSSEHRETDISAFLRFDAVHPAARVTLEEPCIVDPADSATLPWGEPEPSNAGSCIMSQRRWQAHYVYVRNISPGMQGRLDLFKHKATGKLMTVKKIKTRKNNGLDCLADEASIMKDHVRSHPNIVQLQSIFLEPEPQASCNIVMEYCSEGDLFEFTSRWFKDKRGQMLEIFLLHFIASMGEALGYLHLGLRFDPDHDGAGLPRGFQDATHQPVLHRDIKLENIFLRWSSSSKYGMPDIVLGDFGGSVLESKNWNTFGTSGYYPPEVLHHQALKAEDPITWMYRSKMPVMTKASDVYTFGACLCYMMLWGKYKQGMDIEPAFAQSKIRRWPLLLSLLKECLADEPQDRASTETLFNWAAVLKVHIRSLYEHGARMPDGCFLQQAHVDGPGNRELPPPLIHFPQQAHVDDMGNRKLPPPSSKYSRAVDGTINIPDPTTGISDALERICWCPNHGSDSARRRGPNCVPDMMASQCLTN